MIPTAEEIQERNKQIALMLGWRVGHKDFPKEQRWSKEWFDTSEIRHEILHFHTDWNWLMEAVKKVYLLISPSDSRKHDIIQKVGRGQREAAFIAVSDFAKLYNEKKL